MEHGVGAQCVTEPEVVTGDGQQLCSYATFKGVDYVGLGLSGRGTEQTPIELAAERGRGNDHFASCGRKILHARRDPFSERRWNAGGREHLLDEERDSFREGEDPAHGVGVGAAGAAVHHGRHLGVVEVAELEDLRSTPRRRSPHQVARRAHLVGPNRRDAQHRRSFQVVAQVLEH